MCIVYHNSGFISSTMPELHINGRSTYHNFSLENNANGASYDTSSSFMVTGRSHNSTIALSTTTNTMDSENSACGIVSFFIFFIIFFCWGHYNCDRNLARQKKKIIKTQESQESKASVETDPLSPPNYTKL